MPDTKANQKAYPQPNSQKAGCGFPLAKIVVLFSLTTGAAIDILIDKFNVSELKLARQLYNWVSALKNSSLSCRPELRQKLWQLMVHQPLQLRKPRSEPRVRKRRPKSYALMTQPRSVLRQKIVKKHFFHFFEPRTTQNFF